MLKTEPGFDCSASPAAVNNSLLKEEKSEFPTVFGRPGLTTEERFYGW